jgi:hypothetical protein
MTDHHRSSPYEPDLKDIAPAKKKPKTGTKTEPHSNRAPKTKPPATKKAAKRKAPVKKKK